MIMSDKKMPSEWTGSGNTNSSRAEESLNGSAEKREQRSSSTLACAANLVDGKLSVNGSLLANEREPLNTGKWTAEEIEYADGLIDEFKAGNLALPDGTSLRQFLAKMLNCSPKRISKRYEGNNYSKGRKFYVKSTEKMDPIEAKSRRKRLNDLERRYKHKLMHLKMPHLLPANPTAELPDDDEAVGKIQSFGATNNDLSLTAASMPNYLRFFPGPVTNLTNAGLDPTSASLSTNLPVNPSMRLFSPRPSSTAPVLTEAHILSRLIDDAGTLALMTQLTSQPTDSRQLSALLGAQRTLHSTSALRRNALALPQDLLGSSNVETSLLRGHGGFPSLSNPSRLPSLDAELSQLQLQQFLRSEQLLNAAQQRVGLSSVTSSLQTLQANVSAGLPSSSLAGVPLTRRPPPCSGLVQSNSPTGQLNAILQWNFQSGGGTEHQVGRNSGQKRSAGSQSDIQQGQSDSRFRRRLDGPGS